MTIDFAKYHGAGNDFILIDNRLQTFPATNDLVERLCNRHTGIGADGLMLIEKSDTADFKMVYYNADGKISSMCGNGSRCAVIFAKEKGIENIAGELEAYDGIHSYIITKANSQVRVTMSDVHEVQKNGDTYFINTGSPHLIIPTENVSDVNVRDEGKKIRNSPPFAKEGVNVNFVKMNGNNIDIRTYERGVEDETLACGTGCVAAAVWAAVESHVKSGTHTYTLKAVGGLLTVSFKYEVGKGFTEVFLEGPVEKVFEGKVTA